MLDLDVLAARRPGPVGVAVSGGGDSVALLLLLHAWARTAGLSLTVATVDHGLRPESEDEARWVANLCRHLELDHLILKWRHPHDASGNLAEHAREARRALLAEWIVDKGGATIALGHTEDDVAETLLMRLARGSGLRGLSAMASVTERSGVTWLRPLTTVRRTALRNYLEREGQGWLDDPSNVDDRFTRARVRKALAILGDIDITATNLARTATRLAAGQAVIERETTALAASCIHQTRYADLIVSHTVFATAPAVLREQLARAILLYHIGPGHAPRHQAIARFSDCIAAGRATTLSGVQIQPMEAGSRIFREVSAIPANAAFQPSHMHWDHRWTVSCDMKGLTLGLLGAKGLRQCEKRPRDLPASIARGLPALWRGDALVATPVLKSDTAATFRVRHFASLGAAH